MAILHYTIGLPPKRKGGSIQYANDLIKEQSETNKIYVLTCGDTLFRSNKTKIKYIKEKENIKIYKLTNPLTPTLIYGTKEPDKQIRKLSIDYNNIKNFIKKNDITVFHIHTFQGLHKDISEYIKGLGVRIIYTTHDFHGICPHYNFINSKDKLCNRPCPSQCNQCNVNEPSDRFLRLANSYIYQILKNLKIFNYIKKYFKTKGQNKINDKIPSKELYYKNLLDYYKDYFDLIDYFHFNSEQTRNIFISYLGQISGEVIPVVTSGIKDRRRVLSISDTIIFGFIGDETDYKGYPLLKQVFIELNKEGFYNFRLKVFGNKEPGIDKDCNLIEYNGHYSYSELSNTLYNINCMIVPSKCYETFSLVALESLAHGLPVIISNNVGAKDVLNEFYKGFVFSDKRELKNIIKKILLDPKILEVHNRKILDKEWRFSIRNHSEKIMKLYKNNE